MAQATSELAHREKAVGSSQRSQRTRQGMLAAIHNLQNAQLMSVLEIKKPRFGATIVVDRSCWGEKEWFRSRHSDAAIANGFSVSPVERLGSEQKKLVAFIRATNRLLANSNLNLLSTVG